MNGRAHLWILLAVLVLGGAAAWYASDRGASPNGGDGDPDGARTPRDSAGDLLTVESLRGVQAELLHLPYQDGYRAQLQVAVDPSQFPGGEVDLAEIYEVEIRFEDMDPPITDMESTGLLHAGWNERDVEGGYRFFTISDPVPRDGSFAKWQFHFDTSAEPGAGPKLKAGRIRLYDREGTLIGAKDLTIR